MAWCFKDLVKKVKIILRCSLFLFVFTDLFCPQVNFILFEQFYILLIVH